MNTPSTSGQDKKPDLDDLITFNQAAQLSGLSSRHIRRLATAGEIWAKKLGRNWFTTAKAIQDYLSLNKKPGPKPRK